MKKIAAIEILRGWAAMLVVAFHADRYYFSTEKYWTESAFDGFFAFGRAGVEFFFVLSGFLIATVHRNDIGNISRFVPYVIKRFVRVYPFYWLVLVTTIIALLINPDSAGLKHVTPSDYVGSFLLFGIDPEKSIVAVSWTLFYEIIFYAMFSIAIINRTAGISLLSLWMIAVIAAELAGYVPNYAFGFVSLLFLLGAGLTLVPAAAARRKLEVLLALGLMGFLATGIDDSFVHGLPRHGQILAFGLSSCVILYALINLENAGHYAASKFWLMLGQASYSIYLTHMLSLPVLAKILRLLGAPRYLNSELAFMLLIAPAAAAGVAVHRLVERPLVEQCRSRLLRRVGKAH